MTWDPKIGWAAIISVAIFVAGYFLRWGLDELDARRKKRKFYIALFTEVKLNADALRQDAKSMPLPADMNVFLAKDMANRPFIVSMYIIDIYKSNLQMLTLLPDVIIKRLISFYGDIEFINALVKSFENKSFEVVSQGGREQAYLALCNELGRAADSGDALLEQIKLTLNVSNLAP